MIQIGVIVPFLKNLTNVPNLNTSWVECNGQTLDDAESPYNGQTIPNLNGSTEENKRFLRGGGSSGAFSGSTTHTHSHSLVRSDRVDEQYLIQSATGVRVLNANPNNTTINIIPSYYEVVYIMKIK